MTEPESTDNLPPRSQPGPSESARVTEPPSEKPLAEAVECTPSGELVAPKKLTAEEQMALYEKSLKEEDWGHQPC